MGFIIPSQRVEALIDGLESDTTLLSEHAIDDWLDVGPSMTVRDDFAANLLIVADKLAKAAAKIQARGEDTVAPGAPVYGESAETVEQDQRVITLTTKNLQVQVALTDLKAMLVAAWATCCDLNHDHEIAQQAQDWLESPPSSLFGLKDACEKFGQFLNSLG